MRGYRVLKRSGCLDKIAVVKQALTERSLGLAKQHFSSVVMGEGVATGEIIARQYLLVRLGGLNLNRALLLSMGSEGGLVVFPLPREWREVLMQHGFKVAQFRSALLWQFYVCALFLYGVLEICRIAYAGVVASKDASAKQGNCAYFADLVPGNLPGVTDGLKSHDVISWYLQWPGRKSDIDAVRHSVSNSSPTTVGIIDVAPQSGPLPALAGSESIVNFFVWGLVVSAIAAFDCLRGRWWHAFLLNQAAQSAQARFLPVDYLARDYLFHNSGWIYRPLWTYEAEKKGARIIFYFYSTNCQPFMRPGCEMARPYYGYQAMAWPYYLVWDEYQADFVRSVACGKPRIDIVGPIGFSTSVLKMPALPTRAVAVFDVQPVRNSFYQTLAVDFDYYTPKTANQFLTDIHEVLTEADCCLALKRKRDIGRQMIHRSYAHCLEKLDKLPNYIAIDPNVAAPVVIEDCVAVISMPFTSTALLGRGLEKPSIYYDPHGKLLKNDPAAHGVEVISGKLELRRWLASVLANHRFDGASNA